MKRLSVKLPPQVDCFEFLYFLLNERYERYL